MIGIEGDGSAADIKGDATTTVLGITGTAHAKTDWIASLTGRLGWAWDRWLLYAGVVAGLTLVLGFYITPELLGGGRVVMVSMVVSRNVELYDQWGAASAVGVVLLVCVLAIFGVVGRIIPLDRMLGQK